MNLKPLHCLLSILILVALQLNMQAQPIRLKWVNFSPYTEVSQNPNQNSIISESQIVCLLDSLQPYTEGIRTFGTQYGLENVPMLAKQKGFKVIVGIWLGKEDTQAGIIANEQQIANGIAIANAGFADKLIVGSEVLYRNDLPPARLIEYINQVQTACPNVPVSCADICTELINNPDVVSACDFVSPNIYPFWEGVPAECAMVSFHQCYLDLLPVANGKEIFVSESGWKTQGAPVGEAIPSIENAVRYLRELLNWSQTIGVDINVFSAFDEPWKLPNDDGWGIFYSDKTMKPGMEAIFEPIENIDTLWLCEPLNGVSDDTLYVDYIPVIGSFSNFKGHIDNINPCDYKIATYINVGGWWTKPTFDQPAVPIFCNGQWSVDYTTGGQDQLATDICFFVVPADYLPPPCSGCGVIPQQVYQNAVDWICIHRYELPNAALYSTSDTICAGTSIELTATGGQYYLWKQLSNPNNIILSAQEDTASSISLIPQNSPYTTYQVEINDGMGGGAIISKTIVVIDFLLSVSDKIVCNYDSVITLTANTSFGWPLQYQYHWNTGDTTPSIVVAPVSPNAGYTVTVTSAEGCSRVDTSTVYVQESYLIIQNDTLCLGQTTYLYTWGVTRLWSTGETSSSIFVAPDTTTVYSVNVVTNQGCAYSFQDTVNVFYPPEGSLVAYPNPVCAGNSATMVAGGGLWYDWLGSAFDTIPLTTDTIVVVPPYSTNYQVNISNEACHITANIFLDVLEDFEVTVVASLDTIVAGQNTTLTATGGGALATYQWNTGDTSATINVSPSATTMYVVTVTNTDGCNSNDSILIVVEPIVPVIENTSDLHLSLAPNPSNGIFTVSLHVDAEENIEWILIDQYGKIIAQRTQRINIDNQIMHFDLSYLPKGLYFFKIKTEAGTFKTQKILIF